MIGGIAAPGDLFFNGNRLHRSVCRELIPGVQHAVAVSTFHDYLALHHGNACALSSTINRKQGSGYGHARFAAGNVQVARAPLGGTYNNWASCKMDCCISTLGADRELCPLTHFDDRAVHQLDDGVAARGRPKQIFGIQFHPGRDRLKHAVTQAIDRPIGHLHAGAATLRRRSKLFVSPPPRDQRDRR